MPPHRRALGAVRSGSRRQPCTPRSPRRRLHGRLRGNKGRLTGQKRPLKPKDVWAILVRLQLEGRKRDLALFNLAIDSKLRGCDLLRLQVDDVWAGGRVRDRGIVIQKKTGRPVQFEITRQTRSSIQDRLSVSALGNGGYLFPSRFRAAAPLDAAILADRPCLCRACRPRRLRIRHTLHAADESGADLQEKHRARCPQHLGAGRRGRDLSMRHNPALRSCCCQMPGPRNLYRPLGLLDSGAQTCPEAAICPGPIRWFKEAGAPAPLRAARCRYTSSGRRAMCPHYWCLSPQDGGRGRGGLLSDLTASVAW